MQTPVLPCLLLTLFVGCADSEPRRQAAKTTTPGAKSTDDIGEFNPDAGKEVVDSKVQITNPITGPLEAYQPLRQKVSMIPVTQAIELFRATEGRYPKDHEEFMTKVIKANQMRLPQLNGGQRYEYDVENHELLIVRDAPQK